jgi:hypothetical protein
MLEIVSLAVKTKLTMLILNEFLIGKEQKDVLKGRQVLGPSVRRLSCRLTAQPQRLTGLQFTLTSFWILWAFLVMMRCSRDYPRPTYPLLSCDTTVLSLVFKFEQVAGIILIPRGYFTFPSVVRELRIFFLFPGGFYFCFPTFLRIIVIFLSPELEIYCERP